MSPLPNRNNFNLLRLLFSILVIVSLSPELIDGDRAREPLIRLFGTYSFGELAVNSCFIVSGYLVTASWLAAPQWDVFIQKRVLRLIPGFAVAVVVSVLVVGPLSSASFWQSFQPLRFITRISFLFFDQPGFFTNQIPKLNGSLWTIHHQFVCYLLAAALGIRCLLNRPHWVALLVIACLVTYVGVLALQDYASMFSSGGMKAVIVRVERYARFCGFFLAGAYLQLARARIRISARWILFALIAFSFLMLNRYTAPVAVAVPWVYLLFVAGHMRFSTARVFDKADLSYGLYLYAWPIQQLLIRYELASDAWMLTLLTVCAALPVAALSWYCVEKPALRLKPRPAEDGSGVAARGWRREGRDAA